MYIIYSERGNCYGVMLRVGVIFQLGGVNQGWGQIHFAKYINFHRFFSSLVVIIFVNRVYIFIFVTLCNLRINLKVTFFEPAVGSRPNFARMCG